jgi:ABC-type amino acid transport substrate-binding protein
MAASLAASTLTSARPLEQVRQSGSLRVTVYRDYKPFSWIENGRHRGIDVDIAGALAKALNVRLDLFDLRADDNLDDDLRNGVWKGTIFGAAPGDIMMHVPYDKRIEAKNEQIFLVAPYHVDGLALAVDPEKATQASDFSLFLTEKVAVDVGTLADMVLISVLDQKVSPNVVHLRGTERAAMAFQHHEVAGFYGEASAVQSFMRNGSRPVVILYPKTPQRLDWLIGMAVRRDSQDLAGFVDEAMQKLQTSGDIDHLFSQYGIAWRKPEAMQ